MLQALKSEEEMEQQIGRKRLIACAKNLFVPSSTGLTKYDVKKFERYAAWAEKLVSDVVTGCSLRHHTFCIPLVRYLLEGKTLRYQLMQGSRNRVSIEVCPIHFEDRGVEAVLDYKYEEDARLLGKSFRLILMLRLSESIDIVGIATNCLRALTSHFKLVTRSAMGELTLMPNNLQEVSQSFGYDSTHNIEWHTNGTRRWRPDPLCCTEANGRGPHSTSSKLSHILPEQIIYVSFTCYVPALTYSPHSTRDIVGDWPPLKVEAAFFPHLYDPLHLQLHEEGAEIDYYSFTCHVTEPMHVCLEQLAAQTIQRLVREPEWRTSRTAWASRASNNHGAAYFDVEKTITRRVSKRKR
uniref:Uncharacterized protein n=1 Tax=Arundo donax TaxID=35708 RepID=A0A0A9GTD1_ARUDO